MNSKRDRMSPVASDNRFAGSPVSIHLVKRGESREIQSKGVGAGGTRAGSKGSSRSSGCAWRSAQIRASSASFRACSPRGHL